MWDWHNAIQYDLEKYVESRSRLFRVGQCHSFIVNIQGYGGMHHWVKLCVNQCGNLKLSRKQDFALRHSKDLEK